MDVRDTIAQTVDIITRVVQPKKIILFGSAARGTMGENSDIDMLVVVKNGSHRRNTARRIYRELLEIGFATDIVVVTEDDLVTYAETPGMVIQTALSEGQELYAS